MLIVILESVLIVVLLIANGVFAMSELAVVSSRKGRLQHLADTGNARARAALDLANNPDRFLSTVQIGITLVGILAGAFGGATVAEKIAFGLRGNPALAPYGEAIGVALVVVVITYLSLIFGELVPKRLALNNPEAIASLVARPMTVLSVLASPLVDFLSFSTRAVFKLLRVGPSMAPPVTQEELRFMLDQGTQAGVFHETEQDIVESVLRLANRRVSALMTPRLEVEWLDMNTADDALNQRMSASRFSRFPVCDSSIDNVLGVVKAKDYLASRVLDPAAAISDFVRKPLFVPETCSALRLLELFRGTDSRMALVIDEFGSLEGLITTNDVLEAVVGPMLMASTAAEMEVTQRDDGSWLLDGALPIHEFREMLAIGPGTSEDNQTYQTLAGFVLAQLGHLPSAAESFEWRELRFEVVDMDGRRIDKVMVSPMEPPGD
jgi:putative hemolysin